MPLLDAPDERAADELQNEEQKDRNANAMVRVCEAALRPDGEVAENEDGEEHEAGEDVGSSVPPASERGPGVDMEAVDEDGERDEEEEDDGGHDAMGENDLVVLG